MAKIPCIWINASSETNVQRPKEMKTRNELHLPAGVPEEIGKSWLLGIGINDYQRFRPEQCGTRR